MTDTTIHVHAEHEYPVVIGRGLSGQLARMLAGASRVAVVHPISLTSHAQAEMSALRDSGFAPTSIVVPEGEQAKTADVASMCWRTLGDAGFTRNDAIVGIGGGATTDLAGFVAATWLRGIAVVHMPTTLLAMVDAAVGGKTGINTAAGKNLVGSFWSPRGVICDVDSLRTLPRADLVAGMAEVVKVGFVRDASILEDLERDARAATDVNADLLPDLIRRSVQVKADVVAADFKELSGAAGDGSIGREVLNYGHTFGHAVERREHYRWRHGDAVAVGMMFVAELAAIGGRLSGAEVQRHRHALELLGLPVHYPAGHWAELLAAMSVDKKTRGSVMRFVVLNGIGQPAIWEAPSSQELEAAYAAISTPTA